MFWYADTDSAGTGRWILIGDKTPGRLHSSGAANDMNEVSADNYMKPGIRTSRDWLRQSDLAWTRGCSVAVVLLAIAASSVVSNAQDPGPAPNITMEHLARGPIRDCRGDTWIIRKQKMDKLARWNGNGWESLKLPDGLIINTWPLVQCDSWERLWVFCEGRAEYPLCPVAIFDLAKRTWQEFPSYLAALEDQRSVAADFHFTRWCATCPVFGPHGEIAVPGEFDKPLRHYDGTQWNTHRCPQQVSSGVIQRFGRPFFDDSGTLYTTAEVRDTKAHETLPQVLAYINGTWTTSERPEPPPAEQTEVDLRKRPDWPKEADRPADASQDKGVAAVAVDQYDILWYWMLRDGQLYRNGLGLSAPQLLPGEKCSPTRNNDIEAAELLPGGSVMLLLSTMTWLVIRPRQPDMDTQVAVQMKDEDVAVIAISATPPGDYHYVWRLDKGPWNPPQKEPRAQLEDLKNGNHTVEVFALDQFLTPDQTSATVSFSVNVDIPARVARSIDDLRKRDYETRKAAYRRLLKVPDEALPALRAAQQGATNDTKWWIDATIQQIERNQAKTDLH